jgi:hypothetical protein
VNLTVTDDQRTLLVSILQDTLGEVREEVYKAEVGRYREDLHQKETMIRDLLTLLGAPPAAA